MNYPVKKSRCVPANRKSQQNRGTVIPANTGMIPNIFKQTTSDYAMRDGRVHCQAVERTAIYTDAQGNRIVLKENSTTMNTGNDVPNITYTNKGKTFRKRHKR